MYAQATASIRDFNMIVAPLLWAGSTGSLRWTSCSVSVVSSDYPHSLLLSVSVAVEMLLVLNTTTVSVDDPHSSLEAATVLGTHDFCLRRGAGQSNDCEQACNNNRSHSQYLSSFLSCLRWKQRDRHHEDACFAGLTSPRTSRCRSANRRYAGGAPAPYRPQPQICLPSNDR